MEIDFKQWFKNDEIDHNRIDRARLSGLVDMPKSNTEEERYQAFKARLIAETVIKDQGYKMEIDFKQWFKDNEIDRAPFIGQCIPNFVTEEERYQAFKARLIAESVK